MGRKRGKIEGWGRKEVDGVNGGRRLGIEKEEKDGYGKKEMTKITFWNVAGLENNDRDFLNRLRK